MRRLLKRSQFLNAARGAKLVTPGFVLQVNRTRAGGDAGVGFTASRRVGGAVVRNRAKRRLREIARLRLESQARTSCDYVLVARAGSDSIPFNNLLDDLEHAVHMVHKRLDRGAGKKPDGERDGVTGASSSKSEKRTPDTQ